MLLLFKCNFQCCDQHKLNSIHLHCFGQQSQRYLINWANKTKTICMAKYHLLPPIQLFISTRCHSLLHNFVEAVSQGSSSSPPSSLWHFSLFCNEPSGDKQSRPPGHFRPVWLALDNWLPTYLAPDWNICCVLFSASEGYWSDWAFRSTWAPWLKPSLNAWLQAGSQSTPACTGFTIQAFAGNPKEKENNISAICDMSMQNGKVRPQRITSDELWISVPRFCRPTLYTICPNKCQRSPNPQEVWTVGKSL